MKKIITSLRIDEDQKEYLDLISEATGKKHSQLINDLIKRETDSIIKKGRTRKYFELLFSEIPEIENIESASVPANIQHKINKKLSAISDIEFLRIGLKKENDINK